MNSEVQEFWAGFLKANSDVPADTPYQVWYFGNSLKMARDLAELVLSGTKTATASLLETNVREPEKSPIDGGYSVVTDFGGSPICVIRTVAISHVPFNSVDAAFAFDEGEDDRTLETWREGHREYFTKEAADVVSISTRIRSSAANGLNYFSLNEL